MFFKIVEFIGTSIKVRRHLGVPSSPKNDVTRKGTENNKDILQLFNVTKLSVPLLSSPRVTITRTPKNEDIYKNNDHEIFNKSTGRGCPLMIRRRIVISR